MLCPLAGQIRGAGGEASLPGSGVSQKFPFPPTACGGEPEIEMSGDNPHPTSGWLPLGTPLKKNFEIVLCSLTWRAVCNIMPYIIDVDNSFLGNGVGLWDSPTPIISTKARQLNLSFLPFNLLKRHHIAIADRIPGILCTFAQTYPSPNRA
jgi:hypothetical protein